MNGVTRAAFARCPSADEAYGFTRREVKQADRVSMSDIRKGGQVTKSVADLFVEYAEDRIGYFPRALFPPLVSDARMCPDLNLKVSVAGDPRAQDFNILHGHDIGDAARHLEYCPPDAGPYHILLRRNDGFVCRSSIRLPRQQGFDDRAPFVIMAAGCRRLPGVAVPVTRVRQVAFTPMQVCVHPGGIVSVDFLSDFVRARPVAAAFMPQRLDKRRNVGWRDGFA